MAEQLALFQQSLGEREKQMEHMEGELALYHTQTLLFFAVQRSTDEEALAFASYLVRRRGRGKSGTYSSTWLS